MNGVLSRSDTVDLAPGDLRGRSSQPPDPRVIRPGNRLLVALSHWRSSTSAALTGNADGGQSASLPRTWMQDFVFVHVGGYRIYSGPDWTRRRRAGDDIGMSTPLALFVALVIIGVAFLGAIVLIVVFLVLARPTSSCITINQGPGGRIDARRDTHLSFHLSGPPLG